MGEPELRATRDRRCPACQSEGIAPANHLLAIDKLTKEKFRCARCGAF